MRTAAIIWLGLGLTLWGGQAAAIPPLTEAQRQQLATADDTSDQLEAGAWYALLANVAQWDPVDATQPIPGATVPHYPTIEADPDAARGQLFQIEGWVAPRPRSIRLARSGAWGETLTEWVIITDVEKDEVVLVYLVGVPLEDTPRSGTHVRVAARFYKLWPSMTAQNEPHTYLAFVGASPAVLRPATMRGPNTTTLLLLLLAAVGAFIFVLRRVSRLSLEPKPLASSKHRATRDVRLHEPAEIVEPDDDTVDPSLPDDPVAAMAELERRHREADRENETPCEHGAESEPDAERNRAT